MKMLMLVIFCLFSLVQSLDECNSHGGSCDECIRIPGCAWNSGEEVQNHCSSANEKLVNGENVYSPQSSLVILQNKPIDEKNEISPQKAKIKLRIQQPVVLRISFKNTDILVPKRLENIIIESTHKKPDEVTASIQALSCPKDPAKYHQTLELSSYQSNQTLILDVEFICSCKKSTG